MTTNVLQQVSNWETAALANWRRLVIAAARSEKVTQEELSQASALCGRTARQFAIDIATVQRRDQAAAEQAAAEQEAEQLAEQQREVNRDESEFCEWWEAQQAEAGK